MACYQRGKSDAISKAATRTEQSVLKYGESWSGHMQCLFWSSGGVTFLHITLLSALLFWADVDNIWMCWFTWLALRTFRHNTKPVTFSEPSIWSWMAPEDDAMWIFRMSCLAMFIYALTQFPLGPLFLRWIGWKPDDNPCAAYVDMWSALMSLGGVPSSTISQKSSGTKTEPYLTALATISLLSIALKAVLKGQGLRKLSRELKTTFLRTTSDGRHVGRRKTNQNRLRECVRHRMPSRRC